MTKEKSVRLPQVIPPAFARLIENADEKSAQALRREIVYSADERVVAPFESTDPLGEALYRVTENCVHQYPNRILILTTGQCIGYCRYCFRREFTARKKGFLSDAEIDKIISYIKEHPQLTEVLLSGGDPMTASYKQLKKIIGKIRAVSANMLIRLCTRAIIFAPQLFTPQLIGLLARSKPLWIIPHINHPAELGPEQLSAIESCINAGIPMQSQTVLLAGVNDEAEILAELFTELVTKSIKPGYLFQLDTACGTAHFAVPLKKALNLWETLYPMLSGLSRPIFAVDLQQGGGKFSLSALSVSQRVVSLTDTGFTVRKNNGALYSYKDDTSAEK